MEFHRSTTRNVCKNQTALLLPELIHSSENTKTKQEVLVGYAKQANVRKQNRARSWGCNFPSVGSSQEVTSHKSMLTGAEMPANKQTSLKSLQASLFTAGLNTSTQWRALKGSADLRPKYPVFYPTTLIKRIITHLLNTFLQCFHPSDCSPICVEDNLFYNIFKLMILTSVQGVHYVLGRDKDLVWPTQLAIKAATLKKIN